MKPVRHEKLSTRDHSRDSAGLRYVYPVVSRRAGGVSVGINLNPNNACNWRCIYCQVPDLKRGSAPPIDLELLGKELRQFVADLVLGNYLQRYVPEEARRLVDIAISGNGEPTSAPELPRIVGLIGEVLKEFGLSGCVKARLITNGSLVNRGHVQLGIESLGRIGGEVWFKLDAGTHAGFARVNDVYLEPERVLRNLQACTRLCPTWVQTCVFTLDGNGPAEEELSAYFGLLAQVPPSALEGVLLYSLARPSLQPEALRLDPLPLPEMERIAQRIRSLGLTVTVSP